MTADLVALGIGVFLLTALVDSTPRWRAPLAGPDKLDPGSEESSSVLGTGTTAGLVLVIVVMGLAAWYFISGTAGETPASTALLARLRA